MITCINIKTDVWNKAFAMLINDGWKPIYKYDLFDAGIDYDLVVLEKNGEHILFGWDNWVEGEIQAEEIRMKEIEQRMGMAFEQGEPLNLKASVVSLFWTRQ